jgi:hypothetical protein
MKEFNPKEKPSLENAGVNNTLPPLETLEEQVGILQTRFRFKMRGEDLYLNINNDGWAYVGKDGSKFSEYNHKGKVYLVLEEHKNYSGYYLSYKNNGYVGVYGWNNSVAWDTNPLRVKGESWKTYQYNEWVVIGDYDYQERDFDKVD